MKHIKLFNESTNDEGFEKITAEDFELYYSWDDHSDRVPFSNRDRSLIESKFGNNYKIAFYENNFDKPNNEYATMASELYQCSIKHLIELTNATYIIKTSDDYYYLYHREGNVRIFYTCDGYHGLNNLLNSLDKEFYKLNESITIDFFSEIEDYFLDLTDNGWTLIFSKDENRNELHLTRKIKKTDFNVEFKKIINSFTRARSIKEFNYIHVSVMVDRNFGGIGGSTLVWNGSRYKSTESISQKMVLGCALKNRMLDVHISANF
jgi:hypothetical protein